MPIQLLNTSQIELVLKEQELREVVAAYKAAARQPPPPLSPKAPPPPVLGVPVALEPLDKAARARRCTACASWAAGACARLTALLWTAIRRRRAADDDAEREPLTAPEAEPATTTAPLWRTPSALETEEAMRTLEGDARARARLQLPRRS